MTISRFEAIINALWLPGREQLARHVPSLNRLPAKLGWMLSMYIGPWVSIAIVYLIERHGGPWTCLYTQAILVFGAFFLVDVIGLWSRGLLKNIFDDRAYAMAFSFCFMPGLMYGFIPGVIHIATVPGHRLIPIIPALALAAPFFLIGSLIALRVYLCFRLDRFIYMYVYYPEEGELVKEAIFDHIRHPQYASFIFLVISLVIAAASVEALAMSVYILLFGLGRLTPEERELGQRFGDSYRQYRERVPAFFPKPGHIRPFMKYLIKGV